ncbi:hypothetical protein MKW92_018291 [Papaver armeniacum]|nr:hypothetical protein MKW92_018291 [Papaver armeniacum]
MEQKKEETRIQISNPNNPVDGSPQFPSALQQPMLHTQEYHARRVVANGVQITLSKTSILSNCFRGLDGKFHYVYVTPGVLALFRPSLGGLAPMDSTIINVDEGGLS